ncbi:MAG: hypothetical protein FD123_342 [Bacteroidetes bacterium]|nr:MAG: hypothetical protein FD123_342 [Bacteroidota bacterium]
MISRHDMLDAIIKECEICKHLYTKIPADTFDFRPTPGQRSTLELLRYLSICGSAPLHVVLNGSDWSLWKSFSERSATMTAEEFPAAMDRQIEEIKNLFAAIADTDLRSLDVKHPRGEVMKLGTGIVRMPLGWLTAYRMQLFLYAKQSGASDIGTSNNWAGVDRAPAQAK